MIRDGSIYNDMRSVHLRHPDKLNTKKGLPCMLMYGSLCIRVISVLAGSKKRIPAKAGILIV